MDGREILQYFLRGAELHSIAIIGGLSDDDAQARMRSEMVLLAEVTRHEHRNGTNGHAAAVVAPKRRGRPPKAASAPKHEPAKRGPKPAVKVIASAEPQPKADVDFAAYPETLRDPRAVKLRGIYDALRSGPKDFSQIVEDLERRGLGTEDTARAYSQCLAKLQEKGVLIKSEKLGGPWRLA